MAKNRNKRKKTSISPKVLEAQRLNELKRQIYNIFVVAGAKHVYNIIPQSEKKIMLMIRMKGIAIEPEEGLKLTKDDIKLLKKLAVNGLKQQKLKFYDNGPEINLHDYILYGEIVRYYLRNVEDNAYPEVPEVKKAFAQFFKITNEDREPDLLAFEVGKQVTHLTWDLQKYGYLVLTYDYAIETELPPVYYNRFKVKQVKPDKINYTFRNSTYTAYELVYAPDHLNIIYLKIPLEKLGIKSHIKNIKAKVYFTKHVLQRIYERLDSIVTQTNNMALIMSVFFCKTATNSQGQQFIEFYIGEYKVGYLSYIYVEGMVILRTFLLLTNNETPEGEKLNKLIGFEKQDKKYCGIDKLSAFTRSDIYKNERLKQIFEQAGCGVLFKVSQFDIQRQTEQLNHADFLCKYIELNKPDKNNMS